MCIASKPIFKTDEVPAMRLGAIPLPCPAKSLWSKERMLEYINDSVWNTHCVLGVKTRPGVIINLAAGAAEPRPGRYGGCAALFA